MTVAAPTIQTELGLSIVQMSMILTVYFWTYAIGQMPAGRLAERIGSRKVLAGTSALWSLMMIATPFGATFAWLFGCRLVLGGAQSGDWSSGIVAIKRWFPRSERAKGNSALLAGLYLGPIVSAPLTAWTIIHFGWHAVFYGFGVLGLVLGLIWWIGYRDTAGASSAHHAARSRIHRGGAAAGKPAAQRRVSALFQAAALLGVRHPVLPARVDPELLHDLATDLSDARTWTVAEGDGHVCVAAVGCRVHRGVRGRLSLRPHPEEDGVDLLGAHAGRDDRLRGERACADRCVARGQHAVRDRAAVPVVRGGGLRAGGGVVRHAGPRARVHRRDVRLDERMGCAVERGGSRHRGLRRQGDGQLGERADRDRRGRRVRRRAVDFPASRAAPAGPCGRRTAWAERGWRAGRAGSAFGAGRLTGARAAADAPSVREVMHSPRQSRHNGLRAPRGARTSESIAGRVYEDDGVIGLEPVHGFDVDARRVGFSRSAERALAAREFAVALHAGLRARPRRMATTARRRGCSISRRVHSLQRFRARTRGRRRGDLRAEHARRSGTTGRCRRLRPVSRATSSIRVSRVTSTSGVVRRAVRDGRPADRAVRHVRRAGRHRQAAAGDPRRVRRKRGTAAQDRVARERAGGRDEMALPDEHHECLAVSRPRRPCAFDCPGTRNRLVRHAAVALTGRRRRATAAGVRLIGQTVPFARRVTERYGTLNPGERVALRFLLRKRVETDDE
ncbi:hypothetical protein Dimus_034993 [Dionaea muscipula]